MKFTDLMFVSKPDVIKAVLTPHQNSLELGFYICNEHQASLLNLLS